MDAIKIGHYAKNNAWSRIAHRGFYSCICPSEIKGKVSVDDVDLLFWFPSFTTKDEKRLHKLFSASRICGEWFRSDAIEQIKIMGENMADGCSKEEALKTRRRL